jgi:hypothetical protein
MRDLGSSHKESTCNGGFVAIVAVLITFVSKTLLARK